MQDYFVMNLLEFIQFGHVTLVASTGTTRQAPYHIFKSLQLIWRSGAGLILGLRLAN